jgi:hypothetical protein
VRATQKKLIGLAALLGAVAAYWFLLLAPKQEEASALADQVATKQAEVDTAQATVATYEKARAAYRGNYATVVRLGKAVPGDDDVRSLMVQLYSASNRAGVDFETISVGGAAAGADSSTAATPKAGETPPPGAQSVGSAGFWVMPLKFSFGGQFSDLSVFFAKLERFVTVTEQQVDVTGRLLRVDSLRVSPQSAGSRRLRAEVGASSYLVPPSQGVTGGASPSGPAAVQASTPGGTPGTTPPTTSATTTGASVR